MNVWIGEAPFLSFLSLYYPPPPSPHLDRIVPLLIVTVKPHPQCQPYMYCISPIPYSWSFDDILSHSYIHSVINIHSLKAQRAAAERRMLREKTFKNIRYATEAHVSGFKSFSRNQVSKSSSLNPIYRSMDT